MISGDRREEAVETRKTSPGKFLRTLFTENVRKVVRDEIAAAAPVAKDEVP